MQPHIQVVRWRQAHAKERAGHVSSKRKVTLAIHKPGEMHEKNGALPEEA